MDNCTLTKYRIMQQVDNCTLTNSYVRWHRCMYKRYITVVHCKKIFLRFTVCRDMNKFGLQFHKILNIFKATFGARLLLHIPIFFQTKFLTVHIIYCIYLISLPLSTNIFNLKLENYLKTLNNKSLRPCL